MYVAPVELSAEQILSERASLMPPKKEIEMPRLRASTQEPEHTRRMRNAILKHERDPETEKMLADLYAHFGLGWSPGERPRSNFDRAKGIRRQRT